MHNQWDMFLFPCPKIVCLLSSSESNTYDSREFSTSLHILCHCQSGSHWNVTLCSENSYLICQVNLQDPFSVYSWLWGHLLFWQFPGLVPQKHHWKRNVYLIWMHSFMNLLLAYRSHIVQGQTQISIMPPHVKFCIWC